MPNILTVLAQGLQCPHKSNFSQNPLLLIRTQLYFQFKGDCMESRDPRCLTDNYWVTEFNFMDEVRSQLTLPDKVRIHDVTLREAEQAPHIVLRPDEKLRIFEALEDMGVYSVEIFPI